MKRDACRIGKPFLIKSTEIFRWLYRNYGKYEVALQQFMTTSAHIFVSTTNTKIKITRTWKFRKEIVPQLKGGDGD